MKRRYFPIHKTRISRFLFEQEEEGGEDLFADEPDDEGADEPADEGGGDFVADAGGDEGGDDADAEGGEEEEEDATEDDKLGKFIDDDLEALMVDFETQARKSKKLEDEDSPAEVLESLNMSFLFEADYSGEIDLERFTSEVARLIKNYDTLLDMESLILSKAKSFIIARYGDVAADDMETSLSDNHGISLEEPPAPPESGSQVPVAVGAGTPAGG